MGVIMLCLAVVMFSAVVALVRARALEAQRTRYTRDWVQFLRDDLSALTPTR